jgi:hypothetical protein
MSKSREFISSSEESDGEDGVAIKKSRDEEEILEIPYASISKAPNRKATQFKVTIMPRIYQKLLTRDDFFEPLVSGYKDVELIVSKIDNPDILFSKYRSNAHFRIFLDFRSTCIKRITARKVYTLFFRILRNTVGAEPLISEDIKKISDYDRRPEIVIEHVRDKSRAVTWATNEHFPRFTECFEPTEEFSEIYRLHNWALSNINNKFAMDMPFVNASRYSHTRLRAYLDELKTKLHKKHILQKCELGPFNDWRDLVIKWWNDWLDEGWYHKRPQLLLISQPNCGKTMFINEVLLRQGQCDEVPKEAILIPERAGSSYYISNFAWSRANPAYHSVVFCDEYEIKHYNVELLKIILQGGDFNPQKKNQNSGDDINLRIPMIFASNRRLPKIEEAIGLEERFLIIEIPRSFKPFLPGQLSPYPKLFSEVKENKRRQEIDSAVNQNLVSTEIHSEGKKGLYNELNDVRHSFESIYLAQDDKSEK